MKTVYGKLALLALTLLMGALLFLPMRAGEEDSLVIAPAGLRMSVGDSYTLSCALRSEDMDQWLRFESSDPRVATIEADGTVRAHSSGEARITARASGGASAQAQITVAGVPMRSLSLNVDELRLEKGQVSGLKASFNADASDARIAWVSSDENVVRVDATGRLEGVGGGEAYVSAVAASGLSATARVYVDVAGTAMHISPSELTLGVGARVPLRLSFLPLDCTDSVRRWVSSNPAVLSVDERGVISAVGEGSAYLSAISAGGLSCGMEVQVEPAPSGIQLEPSRAQLERGEELQMQLMLLEADGSAKPNTGHLTAWSSSDARVATVDSQGRVTALRSGSCVITAAADGLTASCALNVSVGVQEIALNLSEARMYPDQALRPIQLEWAVYPADADDPSLIFESDNEAVAVVSPQGEVRMTGQVGAAAISVRSASGAQATFTVNVIERPRATATPIPQTAQPPAPSATPLMGAQNPESVQVEQMPANAPGAANAQDPSSAAGGQSAQDPSSAAGEQSAQDPSSAVGGQSAQNPSGGQSGQSASGAPQPTAVG